MKYGDLNLKNSNRNTKKFMEVLKKKKKDLPLIPTIWNTFKWKMPKILATNLVKTQWLISLMKIFQNNISEKNILKITFWVKKSTLKPLNLNQNTKMENAQNHQSVTIWKKKDRWLQSNHKEDVDLVSFSLILLPWKAESKLDWMKERTLFYKNNSDLIVKKTKNLDNMDAMEESQQLPLNSMKKLATSQWIIIQVNI